MFCPGENPLGTVPTVPPPSMGLIQRKVERKDGFLLFPERNRPRLLPKLFNVVNNIDMRPKYGTC